MSDDVIIDLHFVIFYLFSQLFYHLHLPVGIVRGFAFQIREYPFSD